MHGESHIKINKDSFKNNNNNSNKQGKHEIKELIYQVLRQF